MTSYATNILTYYAMAMNNPEFQRRTRALIGRTCLLNGIEWQVLDTLSEEMSLVLRRVGPASAPIQKDAFGSPSRRAPETRIVPLFEEDGELTEEARQLLLALQPR